MHDPNDIVHSPSGVRPKTCIQSPKEHNKRVKMPARVCQLYMSGIWSWNTEHRMCAFYSVGIHNLWRLHMPWHIRTYFAGTPSKCIRSRRSTFDASCPQSQRADDDISNVRKWISSGLWPWALGRMSSIYCYVVRSTHRISTWCLATRCISKRTHNVGCAIISALQPKLCNVTNCIRNH